ncbi:hypothetical protein ACWDSJ_05010 [Nocardia sp. NPDC003482]|uniref:hypothetical protein n=1 Tax=Nocardia sp. NPDC004068 TaxID=3364303 RepID=UPI00368BD988
MERRETPSARAVLAEDLRRWAENWRDSAESGSGRWSWVNLDWIGSVIGPASL